MKTHPIITELETRVADNLKPVDREAAFDSMLDEVYSFDKVGGPFSHMSPSRILREVDPTAHRCGVSDYSDGEPWTEVNGDYYEDDKLDEVKQELVDEIERELEDAKAQVDEIAAKLAALEAHSF